MSRYVKVEDVKDLINGLDSLPWEEETEDIVNRLDTYDTDEVVKELREYGKWKGVMYIGAKGGENYIPVSKAVEIVKREA